MIIHFEDLWEKCESFHKNSSSEDNSLLILKELELKSGLYSALKDKPINEEINKIRTRLFGEILLTLTNLSLRENINVFQALQLALQHREIETYSKKYAE